MPTLTFRSRIQAPAEQVFTWHERPGAYERITPPWADIELKKFEGIREGDRAVLRVPLGPMHVKWVAEHQEYEEGRQFTDVQVKGPFSRWEHVHRVEPDGPDACYLIDEIDFDVPLGKIGEGLTEHRARHRLERRFAFRHRVMQHDLEVHCKYSRRPLRVAVSGSHGLIGSHLVDFLTSGGHEVVRLVRSKPGAGEVYWNHREGEIEAEKLEGMDAVVHLAGENIFSLRWTDDKKMRIMQSRARGTRLIAEALAKLKNPPAVLLSASAIGYYGDRGSEMLTESSSPGDDMFLSLVAQEWEQASEPAAEGGIRVVNPRMAVVLSPAGGALELMLPVFKMGLGGRVGTKHQFFSWIGLDDVLYALYHCIWTDAVQGAANFSSPEPATMPSFTKTLAHVLSRPAFLNPPTPLVRLVSGEAAEELILPSARVLPQKLLDTGYQFAYPALEDALRHQLGHP
ncbi:MAG TPA: TIGR01777 family oxidoreductase, partial [Rhodothermales bacterium]|nr:TIGR01777 family oxidoreductase [Rhodothermales bacterium]